MTSLLWNVLMDAHSQSSYSRMLVKPLLLIAEVRLRKVGLMIWKVILLGMFQHLLDEKEVWVRK